MDLNIHDLRVLVTAGASGIGLATARAFAREGARVHVCDVDAGRARRAGAERCPDSRAASATSRIRPPSTRLFDDGRRDARRPRRAGQQRRHRRTDRALRGHRARRLGAHARRQPDRAVPVRAARDPAAARRARIASIANLSSAAGRFGFPMRTPYAARKWGVDRLHQVAVDRARRRSASASTRSARARWPGRASTASLASKAARARRRRRRRARRSAGQDVAAQARHRRRHRERDRVPRLAARREHLGARAAGRRRCAGVDMSAWMGHR